MRKIRFAVAGCGKIGKRHVAVLDAEENAELVAICDIDIEKCKEQSALYGNIPYYVSYAEMLASIKADVISIATPHALHAPMAIEAAEKKFNVLVEKPMALTVEDCMKMNHAAEKNNIKLWVVKQNRYNIPVKLVREILEKKKLGKIFMVKCDVLWNRHQEYYDESIWRGKIKEEGGALFTQASHFIDLLVWWFGDIIHVNAQIKTQNHDIEIEDSGNAILRFNGNVLGSLNWTTCVFNKNYEGSITILGELGTVKIGGQYLNTIEYWDVKDYPLDAKINFTDKPNAYGKYQGTSSNHDKVVKAIIEKYDNPATEVVEGFEGIKSIIAIEDIYAAVQ